MNQSPARATPVVFGRALYVILAVNFVATIGFSIVLPFLIYLITRLGGNAVVYGILGATFSFFQLLGAPVLGRWSDRFGRRKILLVSQVGTLLAWGIFLIALRLPVRPLLDVDSKLLGTFTLTVPLVALFLSRALDGLSGGNVSVANAYLADISDDSNRSSNFGKMGMWSNYGFIVGPAIAGALGATGGGAALPVVVAFAISALACVIIALWLPEVDPCVLRADPEGINVHRVLGQDHKACIEVLTPTMSARQILALPSVGLLLGLYFLVYLAFNFFYVSFPVYAATGVHWSLTATGMFFSTLAFMMALVQGPLLTWASRIWSDRARVLGGSLVLAASFVFFNSRNTVVIYLGTALLAIGNGIMWPSLLAILAGSADRKIQGTIQGLAGSIAATASIVGLLVGGFLYRLAGSQVFLISAALTLVTFLLSFAIPPVAGKQATGKQGRSDARSPPGSAR